jgi:hypothetical protein
MAAQTAATSGSASSFFLRLALVTSTLMHTDEPCYPMVITYSNHSVCSSYDSTSSFPPPWMIFYKLFSTLATTHLLTHVCPRCVATWHDTVQLNPKRCNLYPYISLNYHSVAIHSLRSLISAVSRGGILTPAFACAGSLYCGTGGEMSIMYLAECICSICSQ